MSWAHLDQFGAEQVGQRPQLAEQVPGAERPVMGYTSAAPGVAPLARIAAEVDARGGVSDLQQRSGDDNALRGDESERAVALLSDAERGDRTVAYVELHRHAPAPFAVVDTQAAQQRAAVADREVGRP